MKTEVTYEVVHLTTGVPVQVGEEIKDLRGDPYLFKGVSKPPSESSTGKITVAGGREFYPGVFKLEIRPA